jgi:hypothetical protein
MSLAQVARTLQAHGEPAPPARWRRLAILGAALLVTLGINIGFYAFPAHPNGPLFPFMLFWILDYLPYGLACFVVLKMPPQEGRWRWIELALILGGALLLRSILLPVNPFLSKDSWRYVWDARVTLHGYSPYVIGPGAPQLAYLRNFIYDNSAFRNVPSIYPPGAQAFYVLSYLLSPNNLVMLKTIFMLFDLASCGVLAYLLKRRGLDMSRAILYAWCPLPIIDFAIQGHLDALTLTFSLLALLCSLGNWRGSRVLTGFLIAMATLTKFYPILLLVVVIRRKDWALLLTCFVTIVVAYIPYLILGHGSVFGFFSRYASEQGVNAGLVQLFMGLMTRWFGLAVLPRLLLEYLLDLLIVGGAALVVLAWRLNEDTRGEGNMVATLLNKLLLAVAWLLRFSRPLKTQVERFRAWVITMLTSGHISMEAATLVLFGAVFLASSHIFPWYTTAILPWAVVLLQPLRKPGGRWNPQGLAAAAIWYFPCVSIVHYFCDRVGGWNYYYIFVYGVVVAGLVAAMIFYFKQKHSLLSKSV